MPDQFQLEVYNILHELKIPPHVLGYEMIKSAMKVLQENPNAIHSVTKELYPSVAKMHSTEKRPCTWSRVERNIRHAIEVSKADESMWLRVLGCDYEVTNSRFLATLKEVVGMRIASKEESNGKEI